MNIEVPGWEPHQGSDPDALSPSSGDVYGEATPIQKTLPILPDQTLASLGLSVLCLVYSLNTGMLYGSN
jgi:hypothetical protein